MLLTWEEIDYVGASFLPLICLERRQQYAPYFRPVTSIYSDFMAIRRTLLRQCPYLIDDAAKSNSARVQYASSGEGIGSSKKSLDPAVQKALALIRKMVLSDSAPR